MSWAKRCPRTRQSGKKTSTGKAGKGNPYLNGVLGEIAASAGRTDTFPASATAAWPAGAASVKP
jgi:transposase